MQETQFYADALMEAAEWERRSLAAESFPQMVECQRRADECVRRARARGREAETSQPQLVHCQPGAA